MSEPTIGSWRSSDYVAEWTATDTLADLLHLPRRMSVALIQDAGIDVDRVVDLGSGAGPFLAALLEALPAAEGIWVDDSLPMQERAERTLSGRGRSVRFVRADLREVERLPLDEADVVLSSRVIHHFDEPTIRRLYGAIFAGLRPGGIFCNLDHFGSAGVWDERFRRVRTGFLPHRERGRGHAHDSAPLEVERHLAWLEDVGFEAPGIPWRFFVTALVVARKPGPSGGHDGIDRNPE